MSKVFDIIDFIFCCDSIVYNYRDLDFSPNNNINILIHFMLLYLNLYINHVDIKLKLITIIMYNILITYAMFLTN